MWMVIGVGRTPSIICIRADLMKGNMDRNVRVTWRFEVLHGTGTTVKKSPPTFVQAGPMDPWALMQKALLDALVL